jgi:hypothetical protein
VSEDLMDICVKEWIKSRVSFHTHPFLDNHGRVLIGYSRILDNMGVSKPEAEIMLDGDIVYLEKVLTRFDWFKEIPSDLKFALTIIALQIGPAELIEQDGLIRAIKEREWTKASIESIKCQWTENYRNIIDVALMIRECDEKSEAA